MTDRDREFTQVLRHHPGHSPAAAEDMQERLDREARCLSRLNEATSLLWRTRDLEQGLQEMLSASMEMMEADFGCIQLIQLVESERPVLKIFAQHGLSQEFQHEFAEVTAMNDCCCGRALRERRRVFIEDIERDFEYSAYVGNARSCGYRAVQSTPLFSPQGQPLGMISTYWRLPHCPVRQELDRLDLYTRQAAEFVMRCRADQKLHDQEAFVQSILNTAADAILTVDADSRITGINAATEELFGYTRSELVHQHISVLMPTSFHEGEALLDRSDNSELGRLAVVAREVLAKCKDGVVFPVELSISEVDHLNLFTLIVRDIRERKQLQREILTIVEDEQRRIGQELHDSAQQELTAVSLLARVLLENVQGAVNMLPVTMSNKFSSLASKILVGAKRAHQEIRDVSHGLIPVRLDANGLADALQSLAARTDSLPGIACEFHCEQPVSIADGFTATHLYRIAQEAVNNALKHAHPRHIRVELVAEVPNVALKITDDGVGFQPEKVTHGTGLKSMEYRSSLINGTLKWDRPESGGTSLTCTVFKG